MADKITNPVTESLASKYIEDIKDPNKGGFTHPHMVTGEDPTDKNIMVSLSGREQRIPTRGLRPPLLVKYATTHRGDLVGSGHYFGGYQMSPEVGKPEETALDVSVGVPFTGRNKEKLPLAEAMRVAAVHNQESVYDPRKNAAETFPKNPFYNKEVPAEAQDKDAWATRWLLDRLG